MIIIYRRDFISPFFMSNGRYKSNLFVCFKLACKRFRKRFSVFVPCNLKRAYKRWFDMLELLVYKGGGVESFFNGRLES